MGHDDPFSQRNKATKRAMGVIVGQNLQSRGVRNNLPTMLLEMAHDDTTCTDITDTILMLPQC